MGAIELLASDFTLSFMWVWSGVLLKILAFNILGFVHDTTGEIIMLGFSLLNLFFFAILMKLANGAAYNSLTILANAISGGFDRFLFTVGARIPSQVLGSIYGVRLLIHTFPAIDRAPKLNVNIHHGALTEGLFSFVNVLIYLSLARSMPESFVRRTWIYSFAKLTLNILGSDLTGGYMNPVSVTGWAYARGAHITEENVMVYWLGPLEGTLLATWVFMLLFQNPKNKTHTKFKKE